MPHVVLFKLKRFYLVLLVAFSFNGLAQHKIINSGWQFSKDQITWQTIDIPHTWNKADAFDDDPGYFRGKGYYRKELFIPKTEAQNINYLKFNAVNQHAMVKVNGKSVGTHKGGYTAFNFNIASFLEYGQYNLIEVVVDNSYDSDIPPLDADFTFYGGIYRDVELISLPKQHLSLSDFASDGFYVNYYKISKNEVGVEVQVLIDNLDNQSITNQLGLSITNAEGQLVSKQQRELTIAQSTTKSVSIKFPEIKQPILWTPEAPYLYRLNIELTDNQGNTLDSKDSNLGFRWVSVHPEKGFFLNGEPIKLIGVNRHQDYEGYANAVPMALQKQDIQLIKTMGANVIRFAHYPHARELYVLCDKLGILVWTEIPVINLVTDSEAYFETSMTMQTEHVKQYYNHASVVMFGYMNEIFIRMAFNRRMSDNEKENLKATTFKLASELESLTRRLAPNHLTVMACHLNEIYNETGIADLPMLLGWNLYFGWYDNKIDDLGPFFDEQHRRFPERTLFLSEYGPGADTRIFTKNPRQFDFSTDYQAKLHQSYYQQIQERPFVAGMTAWNFADFGSEFRGDAIPHVNQKGLVQYDRTPKDIYYWYQSVLDNTEPFLHIAANNLKGLTLFADESYPVQIYSNLETGVVYLNDEYLTDIHFENGVATVDFLFKNRVNQIKVNSEHHSEELTVDVLRIGAIDFKDFDRFGINMGAHFYFVDEERQLTFVPDQAYKKGQFGYLDGKPFGMSAAKNQGLPNNIKNSRSEPLFQTMLEGCSSYKVDIPDGSYKVTLFFVEPQIRTSETIYNLKGATAQKTKEKRVFDVLLNKVPVEEKFDMALAYPEKYGVSLMAILQIVNGEGLTVSLKPREGQPVISGILIENQAK